MKVFLTLEREKGDKRIEIDHLITKCMGFIDLLETNNIPNQFKVTSLPRRKYGFKLASELENIEPQ